MNGGMRPVINCVCQWNLGSASRVTWRIVDVCGQIGMRLVINIICLLNLGSASCVIWIIVDVHGQIGMVLVINRVHTWYLGSASGMTWIIVDGGCTLRCPVIRTLLFMSFSLGRSSYYILYILFFLGLLVSCTCFSRSSSIAVTFSFCHFENILLVLGNLSKPQYNLKTNTKHSTLIARTHPLSKTLRDKIPKATMKFTDFVKPP